MADVYTDRLARPGLMTVRKGNRRNQTSYWAQGGRFFLAFTASLVFVAFALGIVWSNHQIVQTGYSISDLHKQKDQMSDYNRKLKVELANLTSLDRLERVAKTELGLVNPGPEQVQVIE